MSTIWLILLTVGAAALIGAIYFAKARNENAPRSEIRRAERGARELREQLQRDPEYRED